MACGWPAYGGHGVGADAPLVIDTDATLITAQSEKQQAAPTFKNGFVLSRMGSTRRNFAEEYKQEAVGFVIDGNRRIAEVACNIGVQEMTLGNG